MTDDFASENPTSFAPDAEADPAPQRRHRRPIHGVLVALDAPSLADKPWVVDGIDINANGMGLVLPPELAEGTEVWLSFQLDDAIDFSRMPGIVRHHASAAGGVEFAAWPPAERLRLLESLVRYYEVEIERR